MILTRDGKEIAAIYRQDGSEVEDVKDANGRIVYSASREITGTLPLSFTSRGKPLTNYMIYGNTVQDGTPTPEAPADVLGCGVWDETQQSYKLPLTVNDTEYPIYLGQVPTTRRIKKLVLTGDDNFGRQNISSADPSFARFSKIYQFGSITSATAILYASTHFIGLKSFGTSSSTAENCFEMRFSNGTTTIMIVTNAATYATSFNQWLSDQYAAGTPVTIWYALDEPETGNVNEPLMKIGNYADTISMAQAGVTISTVSGSNVLDMSSTVKPSEVYIKGKGIKPIGNGG